jgi:hypothetical protein
MAKTYFYVWLSQPSARKKSLFFYAGGTPASGNPIFMAGAYVIRTQK